MSTADWIALPVAVIATLGAAFGIMRYIIHSELGPLETKVDDHALDDDRRFAALFSHWGLTDPVARWRRERRHQSDDDR